MPVTLSKPASTTSSKKPGQLERIRIEMADGGFIVYCSRRESAGMDGPMAYGGSGTGKVFADKQALLDYISEEVGGGDTEAEAGSEEASEEE